LALVAAAPASARPGLLLLLAQLARLLPRLPHVLGVQGAS
jgi:hypothetical protein